MNNNIGVAVLDTGIYKHIDFGNRIIAFKDLNKTFWFTARTEILVEISRKRCIESAGSYRTEFDTGTTLAATVGISRRYAVFYFYSSCRTETYAVSTTITQVVYFRSHWCGCLGFLVWNMAFHCWCLDQFGKRLAVFK